RGPNVSYMLRRGGTLRSLGGEPSALPLKSAAAAAVGSPGLIPPSLPPAAPNGRAWHETHGWLASVWPVRNTVCPAVGLPVNGFPGTVTLALGSGAAPLRYGLGGEDASRADRRN